MCYTGKCKYEGHMGNCQVPLYRNTSYPDDAHCIQIEKEVDELEQVAQMKRCPHCGSNQLDMEKILLPTWDGKPRYVIVCECSASGPKARSEDIARRRWNGRTPKK